MTMLQSKDIIFLLTVTVCLHITYKGVECTHPESIREHQTPERSEEDRRFLKDSGFDPDSISPETVVIKPPSYTDEEQLSKGMPQAYQCDGCRIIAYQFQKRFSAQEKKNSGKILFESEIIDIVEGLCTDAFEGYGLMSSATGDKYLVGEGLNTAKQSGSLDNGSLWSGRLLYMCMEILDAFDEDEIYQMYKSSKGVWEGGKMCSRFCLDAKQKHNIHSEL